MNALTSDQANDAPVTPTVMLCNGSGQSGRSQRCRRNRRRHPRYASARLGAANIHTRGRVRRCGGASADSCCAINVRPTACQVATTAAPGGASDAQLGRDFDETCCFDKIGSMPTWVVSDLPGVSECGWCAIWLVRLALCTRWPADPRIDHLSPPAPVEARRSGWPIRILLVQQVTGATRPPERLPATVMALSSQRVGPESCPHTDRLWVAA